MLLPMSQKSLNAYGIPPQEFLKQIQESHNRSPETSMESQPSLPHNSTLAGSLPSNRNINQNIFPHSVLGIENLKPELKINNIRSPLNDSLDSNPSKKLCKGLDKGEPLTEASSPNNEANIEYGSVKPFIRKLHDFVNDPSTDEFIRWSHGDTRFEISDPDTFSKTLLPRYFKHKNISSFIRQLNLYGFTKIQNLRQGVLISDADSEVLQFQHPKFQKHRPDLLCEMTRKSESKSTSKQDISHVITELDQVKKNQGALTDQLSELQHQNERLWKENQEARIQNKAQRETINKILHFLGTLFSSDKQPEKLQKRRLLLLDQPNDNETTSASTSNSLSDPNAAFAKILQDYNLNHSGPTNDLQLGNFPYFNLPANQFLNNDGSNILIQNNNLGTNRPNDSLNPGFSTGVPNNSSLIQSFDSGAGRTLENVGQSLQTNQSNLELINNNMNNIQNNLTSMEALLRENEKPESLSSTGLTTAPDFLNQYITCGQEMIPFDYNAMFLDSPFLLQNSVDMLNGTPANMPSSSNNLGYDSNPKTNHPNIELGSSIPNLEEEIEEIVTEPPPMSTISSILATSPSAHDNTH